MVAADSSKAPMMSGNSKSLLVMFILFSLITATQYVAAIVAHSLALQADCASMAVDAISYLFNMAAECQADRSVRALLELVMSFVSLVLLSYFTGFFFVEAALDVGFLPSSDGANEDTVDPALVLIFAGLGILFDMFSLFSYKVWHVDEPRSQNDTQAQRSNINMFSALLHVLADTARSTTTFVEGLILMNAPGLDSATIDGWCALIVCALIAIGVLGGAAKWCLELRAYLTTRHSIGPILLL